MVFFASSFYSIDMNQKRPGFYTRAFNSFKERNKFLLYCCYDKRRVKQQQYRLY